jgi:hypothetical protein
VSLRPSGAAPAYPLLHGISAAAESAEEGIPKLLIRDTGALQPDDKSGKRSGRNSPSIRQDWHLV